MTKVIGYVRVSTEEQSRDGVSLEAQRAKLAAYCDLYDLDLVEVVEDAGVSAKSLRRPGLDRVLELLAAGEADGLVVEKMDRLSRSIVDWNLLIDRFFGDRGGRSLFSVGEQIDTRTASGRMVLNVLMSVSQWEREAIGERTRDALAFKRSRSERIGPTPYGFDLAEDGVHLVENAAEQAVSAEIRKLAAGGMSRSAIARDLNGRGLTTKQGKRWSHTHVGRVLKAVAA